MTDSAQETTPEQEGVEVDGGGQPLARRIALLLSLALLPLGSIAVVQSIEAIDSARENYRNALAAQTEAAARPERETISRAFNAARGLALAMPPLLTLPERCIATMRRMADVLPEMTFAGFIEADQVARCNNRGEALDFSGNPESNRIFATPEADVTFNPAGEVSGAAVVIVSLPVFEPQSDDLLGFVSLSFPTRPLVEAREAAGLDDAIRLLTFSKTGRVLTSDIEGEGLDRRLPASMDLQDLASIGQSLFTAEARDGVQRDYAVVPILPGQAYALGIWRTQNPLASTSALTLQSIAFPILMWLVSLAVAVIALRRLVIVPVRTLRMRMRAFADGRGMFRANSLGTNTRELREIGEAFEAMADQIVHEEAEMENRVYEREVLLREVHHRVKNNLQLMSSIINMQIRQNPGPQAEDALRRVQGRLASLAKFHQDLYESSSVSQLRADELLEDLARQMVAMSKDPVSPLNLRLDLDRVTLVPDQASPLAMLVTEALTNAIKYAEPDVNGDFFVAMSLKTQVADGDTMVTMAICNSVTEDAEDGPAGLGTRLVQAFGSQLEGRIHRGISDGVYTVRVEFPQKSLPAIASAS